ncbi:ubiquinone/menaquinone biosynthesis protein [Coccidioides immitis RS]|uniref:Ubiquinone/menaquinone biosynthesis protein n=4 Tax=Coccidioides immitis TaxID=5501 RepID=J3KBL8_COCIM|nr:ubiquinone/menaquinone biosynthesis protein [Coccidioides immitis RS]KMP07769.1 methyltransferase OMS1 [Coccidioides immitis RMSCC 2394]KMU71774.1 methyltransferase OMS1 [Coccidioides immitis RMSCC 3703]KMU82857.1 methyltransferase OMS1 [Coccidioides immitis H538.4]TPX25229.1 hypothetical protein DIZ76_010679 [Coccidioides immitis]EAS32529.3 ubiquinone/menaquinone biosynthesis protein [Coccidioides immitis RS]
MPPAGTKHLLGKASSKHIGHAMGRKSLFDPLHAASPRSARAAQKKSPLPPPTAAQSSELPSARSVRPKMLTLAAVAVFAFSTYGTYLFVSYKKAVEAAKSLDVPHDLSDRYDQSARTYDAEVETAEMLMRLGKRRRELIQMARGNVLEVSCGTGRNFDYYTLGEKRAVDEQGKAAIRGCRSVTFVDQSGEMVQVAREKFEKKYPAFKQVAFRAQDAMEPISPPPGTTIKIPVGMKEPKFDTVIETMGLCSTADPVAFLKHLGELTEPEKGQILLLEHGRSYYGWLNKLLDDLAPAHADQHGCWWNRDIGRIVEQSGLEVVESKRWHLGTTWKYVLRPKKETERADKETDIQNQD